MYPPTEEELSPLLTFAKTTAFTTWRKLYPKPPIDDLISEANFGLAKAVKNFNPTLGVPFSAYAMTRIKWSMGEYIREVFGNRSQSDGEKSYKIRLRKLSSIEDFKKKFYFHERYDKEIELAQKFFTVPFVYREIVQTLVEGHTVVEAAKIHGLSIKTIQKARSYLLEIAKSEHFLFGSRPIRKCKKPRRQASGKNALGVLTATK